MSSAQEDVKVITVLGATGNQGGGVVQALLKNSAPCWHVRAITRDTCSAGASKLRAKFENDDRLEIVAANVYDKESLFKAFKQVFGVFAVTNNRLPGHKIDKEEDMDHELEAGRNIIDAAKACGVQHIVLSSLPNLTEASNRQFKKVFHFDNKSKIEQWAKDELLAVTALHPGLFYTNMQWSQYCQLQDDGTVRFCAPIEADRLADWVDPSYDIGVYAAGEASLALQTTCVLTDSQEIFRLGPQKTASKTYPVVGPKLSFAEFAKIFSDTTSRKAVFDPITLDQWGATVAATVGKGYEEDIRQMMQWISVAPDEKICYGTMDPRDDMSWEDLGVRASTFAEWMERASWRGP
ncbi:hypothetical protein E8E15_010513 [Penicillium rubens]|uniref:Pc22g13640 protein n=2 Tax=Penicillium chrysogenum species complex TaxID=254878 RepID=B6HTL7_PENRW|nr:hypothetical protein E8E15_010513 [Penicillium rubens]KAJ5044280.1 hypothetical protein NUH16_001081 [Penicillium rubens]KZN91199.1 NmrA-like family domain-containing protein [Penicillium chrysogenum]CAP98652.1 Pc22g13640 [Penicillium rubens Wisconsin 54-1255]